MEEPLMDANEAVIFLAKMWGMDAYSTEAFNKLRQRRGIVPDLAAKTATFYKESTLRRIPKPDKSSPRMRRAKHVNEDEDEGSKGAGSSMLLSSSVDWSYVLAPEEVPDLALAGGR